MQFNTTKIMNNFWCLNKVGITSSTKCGISLGFK